MKRITFIDIARAFAIFFIVYGHVIIHSNHCIYICKVIYSFHVALFFIISGYLFKYKEKFGTFIKNKIIRILIPYFIWSILLLIPYYIFGNDVSTALGVSNNNSFFKMIINIFVGNGYNMALKQNSALWFLPALFSMELVFYFILNMVNKVNKYTKMFIISLLFVVIYIFNNYVDFVFPFGINSVITMSIFFLYGLLINKYKLFERNNKRKYLYFIMLIVGILAALKNSIVQPIDYIYGNLLLFYVSGVCISTFVLFMSSIINKNRVLEFIGRNTMVILLFHKLFVVVFQTKIKLISDIIINSNIFYESIVGVIISIISILISIIIGLFLRKTFPLFIGEKTK